MQLYTRDRSQMLINQVSAIQICLTPLPMSGHTNAAPALPSKVLDAGPGCSSGALAAARVVTASVSSIP